jgi:hypothetical protein
MTREGGLFTSFAIGFIAGGLANWHSPPASVQPIKPAPKAIRVGKPTGSPPVVRGASKRERKTRKNAKR